MDRREHLRARKAVYRAVKSGALVRPDRCEMCGHTARVEAHHWRGYDAAHMLDVQWLCRKDHAREHPGTTPEQRSANSRRLGHLTAARMTAAERAARSSKAGKVGGKIGGRVAQSKLTYEERVVRHAKIPPERRRELALVRNAGRTAKLSPERRSEIARLASRARWAKTQPIPNEG